MSFLDNMIFGNNLPGEPNKQDLPTLGEVLSAKLRQNPNEAVDVNSVIEAQQRAKQAVVPQGDIFEEYIDGVSGGRRLKSLKNILNKHKCNK